MQGPRDRIGLFQTGMVMVMAVLRLAALDRLSPTPSSASHPGQCDKDGSEVETLGSGTEIDIKRESLLC